MKLRNKKTGEIADLAKRGLLKSDNDDHIIVYPDGTLKYYAYGSIAELNAEWEDSTPKEPLIKDEKIRKTLRTWAELNGIDKVVYDELIDGCETYFFEDEGGHISIQNFDYIYGLEEGKVYTIAELCGEEDA